MTDPYSLEALSALPSDRLHSIMQMIATLVPVVGQAAPDIRLGREEEQVWLALCSKLSSYGYASTPFGWKRHPRSVDRMNVVLSYAKGNFHPKSAGELRASLDLLFTVVCNHLERCSVPVSLKTVLAQLENIAGLVERELPGYRGSGFLPSLLKRGKHVTEE